MGSKKFQNMIHFYDLARNAVENTSESENKVTWNVIRESAGTLMHSLASMKFKGKILFSKFLCSSLIKKNFQKSQKFVSDPVSDGEVAIKADFEKLNEDLSTKFNSLVDI